MHRDLKPSNICCKQLADGTFIFLLMDFGGCCAKSFHDYFNIYDLRWATQQSTAAGIVALHSTAQHICNTSQHTCCHVCTQHTCCHVYLKHTVLCPFAWCSCP